MISINHSVICKNHSVVYRNNTVICTNSTVGYRYFLEKNNLFYACIEVFNGVISFSILNYGTSPF